MRVAIYLYVSEKEGLRAAESQLLQLKAMAARDGWEVTHVYHDDDSSTDKTRPEFQQMLADAKQHCFDVLLFRNLKSLSQHGAGTTLALLNRLIKWGIGFCSYEEQHLNTCHYLKDAVLSLIATLAQQDGVYIGHRTRMGLARQQQTQKPGSAGRLGPGRPRARFDREKAKILYAGHASYEQIAEACGTSKATICRFLKSFKK